MKKIKSIIIILISIFITVVFMPDSNASSLILSVSKSNANVGDEITITINGSGLAGKVALSVSGNATLSNNSIWVDNSSTSVNAKITGEGNITITATPIDVSDSNTALPYTEPASTTITVSSNSGGNSSSGGTSSTKSNIATLSNLGIRPNDFSGFTNNKTTYNVTVPTNVEKIEVYAKKGQSGQTITGTGNKTLKEGINTFNVVVTAEDGKTTKTYTINVTRGESTSSKSNVATLANLGISPNDFTGFKADKTEYQANVPSNIDKIEVYAKKSQDGQTIEGTGTKTLEEGLNKFEITVTAEDGQTKKTYIINVTRGESTEEVLPEETTGTVNPEDAFGLSELKIDGLELKPEFKTDVYEYQVDLLENKDKLEITTSPTNENLIVEILGNEDLKDGENIITIIVKDESGENEQKTITYQILVNKKISLLEDNTEHENQQKMKKIIVISIAGGIFLVAVIVVIVFKLKNSKKDETSIPYLNMNFENEDENESFKEIVGQVDESYEEKTIVKKRSKGKRFK